MNPAIIATAAMAGGGLFFVVWTLFGSRGNGGADNPALGRLERYIAHQPVAVEEDERTTFEQLIGSFRNLLKRIENREQTEERVQQRDALAAQLQKANLALRPIEWKGILLVAGGVAFVLVTARFGVVPGVAAALATPLFGGRFMLRFRQRQRVTRFDNQLGDVILMLANALKAGYSFPQALMSVSNTAPMPIAGEFGRTSREMQLGLPVDDALRRIVERNASEDLDLMITAVQIHRVVGGNLTEILESIATTIRERVRIKGEIRTLTAQARASGWIISLLPVGLAAVLTLIAPDYFTPMFKQLFGQIMLGVGVFSMGCGIMIIRKIVSIRV